MKIAEVINSENEVLASMRNFLSKAPADSVYTIDELSKAAGWSALTVRNYCRLPEFRHYRVRDGRRHLYGSKLGIAAFIKAKAAKRGEN